MKLISDFITDADRKRYEAMPDGAHKRAVARRFENEILKRLGMLLGEPEGATPNWKLFPDDESSNPKLTSGAKSAFSPR